MVKNEADVDAVNKNDNTPLLLAAINGNWEIVYYLISEAGADVKAKNNFDQTTLHWASGHGDMETVEILIDEIYGYNAYINAQDDDDKTPLHWAAESNQREIYDYLEKNGADQIEDNSGMLPSDLINEEEDTNESVVSSFNNDQDTDDNLYLTESPTNNFFQDENTCNFWD